MSEIATGSKEDKQARVRKAVCRESGPHGLEQGKGASPTYCYNLDMKLLFFLQFDQLPGNWLEMPEEEKRSHQKICQEINSFFPNLYLVRTVSQAKLDSMRRELRP
jgi:hypothetical protein